MKQCRLCGETKPLDQFYKHKFMRGGYINDCKPCYTKHRSKSQDERRGTGKVERGWTFDAIPTMKRSELVRWAASRYGLIDPSPDDILMRRWVHYDKGDQIHVTGYHADFSAAIRAATAQVRVRLCKVCSTDITGENANKRYCSQRCSRIADTSRRENQEVKRSPRTAVTDAEKFQIVELYERGDTLLEITMETGRSYGAIKTVLNEMGIARRKRGKDVAGLLATLNVSAA